MPSGFHHAAVAVSDLRMAVAFYDTVVGLDPVGPDDPDANLDTADYVWLRVAEDEWLNLAQRPAATPAGNDEAPTAGECPPVTGAGNALDDPHLALRVTEKEQAALRKRLQERAIDHHESPSSLYFRDPDGNLLEATVWDGPE